MRPLTHFAEPYSAQGNIDARAAARAIGRPRLDAWDVFLRETLQNSWDARLNESNGVTYSVDGYWPTPEQIGVMRSVVFPQLLDGSPLKEYLDADLDDQPVLVVTDSGTKGLGGPTRADLVTDEATDFVDFVRNVGRAAEKALGGGTYGFGKGILWQMSWCSTVLVYTKSTYRGQRVSRFIAIGHTDSYAVARQRYTGRHWWGRADAETLIEPIEGPEADQLAEALGMSRLSDRTSGTAIMVLEPRVSESATTMDEIVQRIANAALWWAWPHLVDETVDFSFTSQGQAIEAPHPDDHPVLKYFADAYRRTSGMEQSSSEWPWKQEVLHMQRPQLRLGSLVWRRIPREELEANLDRHVEISSHVALMRQPRFIVQYKPVREDPHGQGTIGVFVAHGDRNDDFAKAEPVAHDDWSPSHMGLPKGARNPVKKALELIRDAFAAAAVQVPPEATNTEHQRGLVRLATRMGDLVTGSGDARYVRPGPSGGGGGSKLLVARVVGRPLLTLDDGRPIAEFQVEARVPSSASLPIRVTASPVVLTEAGAERDTELAQPEVIGWSVGRVPAKVARHGLLVEEPGNHLLSVLVTVPADTAVGLSVQAREEGDS